VTYSKVILIVLERDVQAVPENILSRKLFFSTRVFTRGSPVEVKNKFVASLGRGEYYGPTKGALFAGEQSPW